MNLVQKLPIGLSLACLMMMSSCSKEDIQTPKPQTENENTHSNLKEGIAPAPFKLPYLASTIGLTGFNTYPTDWERSVIASSSNLLGLPTATSSLTALFGNAAHPWKKPLPPIPPAHNANSILTFTSHATGFFDYFLDSSISKRSSVKTKIKNLIPGKKYRFTVYAATTICKEPQNGYTPAYAQFVTVTHSGTKNIDFINFDGKESVWVSRYLSFIAEDTETNFYFSALTASENEFTYGHIFIDGHSLIEI